MELSVQLVGKVQVKKSQANKMTNVDGGTLEGTLHEERQAMMATSIDGTDSTDGTVHRAR